MKDSFYGNRKKEERIIKLWYNDHTYDQIAKELHSSPNYICTVIKREKFRVEKEKSEKQNARALELFSRGKSPLHVSIKLAISADEAARLYNDSLKLTNR